MTTIPMQDQSDSIALNYADDMPTKPTRYAAMEAKRRIERAQRGEYFYSTGLGGIDKLMRLRPATYTVVAAQSGTGKTAMALQVAEQIEKIKRQRRDERATLIFSAEMASAELIQRMAAGRTGISVWQQESGQLTPDQVGLLERTFDAIADTVPFQIDEEDSPNRDHILQSCEIVAKSHGLSMVIFDYIELATSDERFKAEHVRSVAKTLKNIARRYDIPTIGISQVNKDVSHRANKQPEMTDLRYGGHEPADGVIILQDAADVQVADPDYTPVKAWIVKNRSGKRGSADLLFHGPTTRFVDADFQRTEL